MAKINFEVHPRFHISPDEIEYIKNEVAAKRKTIRYYRCEVLNEDKSVVVEIEKELYIRKISTSRIRSNV